MTPDDPRHGTRAGYQAHRKVGQPACPACLRGRAREDKTVRYDHHRGIPFEHSPDDVRELLFPWLAMGLSYHAIGQAAGLGGPQGARLGDRLAENRVFRRSTYEALASVTEDAFPGGSHVYAHLTRQRICSLMAAGHSLRDMPILPTGQWRQRTHLGIDQARAIRDHYAALQYTQGNSPATAAKARNRGHRPPAAWDDPGTVAWPLGWTEPTLLADDGYDQAVVERVLGGDWRRPATDLERTEVARRWYATGRSLADLERLTGWKPDRYYRLSDQGDAA